MSSNITIQDMQKIALSRGGFCLSEEYKGARTKLRWKCGEGHIWQAMPAYVKRGNWCPKCSYKLRGKSQSLGLDKMKRIASKRGGKCLSSQYENAHQKLQWECSQGHKWNMKPMSIQQGQWCPECSSARNERICKKIFEITFNAKFPKTRPQWLRSNKNHPLELDGFCRNLNLAFEYQGRQHYALSRNFFGLKNNDELLENDKLKKKLCENKGVILIEVPYQVKVNEMQNYIVDQCKKKHVDLPKIIPPIDFSKIDVYSDENLKSLQKISKKKGGFCLSEKYLGTLAKLSWQCSYGHTWEATPSSIRSGYWCPKCAGKQKLSIEEMREVAKKYNGECLSKKYINNRTKLEWRCVNGHTWKATASDVRAGHWCLKCSAQKIAEKVRKYDIADMEKVANKKQGKCLSKKFLSIHKKLMWQCLNKHKWMAQPANVMRGSWCPICAKDRYKILKNEKIKL